MIEDESRVQPQPGTENYAESLLYDYAKFLTTLALLALGGVLSLSQTDDLQDVRPFNLALVVVSISIGGIFAFALCHGIVSARAADKAPSRWLRYYMTISLAGIGIGLGAFLKIFWDAVS